MPAAGLALWPQSPGDQGVDVCGWMVSSITSLSDRVEKGGNRGPLENYLTICEATTVSVGVCLILCMALTSFRTSACKSGRENMSVRLLESALLSEKESDGFSTRDKAKSLITLSMLEPV